jgi:hypothetical protein
MASYGGGKNTEEPGQYPTTTWSQFGLPEQNFGSGAAGSSPPSNEEDTGGTNQPGQYPSREDFTGVALDGSGAPGTQGVSPGTGTGSDSVTYSGTTFYKGERDPGGMEQGYLQKQGSGSVSGPADWTQANAHSYGDGYDMPGVAGNTPTPGSGQHQTGAGNVMYGGWLKGSRPATSKHTSGSGPGT